MLDTLIMGVKSNDGGNGDDCGHGGEVGCGVNDCHIGNDSLKVYECNGKCVDMMAYVVVVAVRDHGCCDADDGNDGSSYNSNVSFQKFPSCDT